VILFVAYLWPRRRRRGGGGGASAQEMGQGRGQLDDEPWWAGQKNDDAREKKKHVNLKSDGLVATCSCHWGAAHFVSHSRKKARRTLPRQAAIISFGMNFFLSD
jgi:hypothetical protein